MSKCCCPPYWQDKDEMPGDEPIGRSAEQANAELRAEVARLRAHRDGLYRVFGWLARDDRKMLSAVDETIQADVDSIIADRARQTARVEKLEAAIAEMGLVLDSYLPTMQLRLINGSKLVEAMDKLRATLSQPEAGT